VTSPLVPWNSCGAYMTGVLGVPTIEYLPYAFFNIVNPLIAVVFGFTGIRVERIQPPAGTTEAVAGEAGVSAEPG
jgi:Na+:H+ antiporter, NhaC family